MTAMQISRVDEDTMKFVHPVFIFGRDCLVDEGLEVNLKREFMTIIDLER
jgi:hypothetical protein